MPSRYEPRPQPYGYSSYQGGDRILDLIMRGGQIQSEGAQRNSDIWGQALSGIGQTLAGGITQYGEEKKKKEEQERLNAQDQAFLSRISDNEQPAITPAETLRIYGPQRGAAIYQGYASLQSEKPDLKIVLAAYRASTPQLREAGWPQARQHLVRAGFPQEQLPEQYNDGWFQRFDAAVSGGRQQREPIRGRPGDVFLDPETMQQQAAVPEAPTAPRTHVVGRDLVDDTGRVIHRAPPEPRAQPDGEPLVAVIGDDGQSVLVPRRQAAGRRPASNREQSSTGAEKTALSFYNDARQAATDADAVSEKLGNAFVLKYGSNLVQSDEQQQYWQAVRSFTEARLRKRSGAAIPEYEIEKDAKMYFKQPGDSDAVLKQKKASRDRTIDGIRIESGRAYAEYYGEPAPRNNVGSVPPPPAPGAGPAAPAGGAAPVRVNSPEEAARLAPGTLYQTPDGRTMRR